MGQHNAQDAQPFVQPFTRLTIDGDGYEQVEVFVRTNDPFGRNVGEPRGYVSNRRTMYRRIGKMSAMDRVVSRAAMIPVSHEITVVYNGRDITECF